jgi:cobalt/nickel transport system permease protein
MHLGNGAITPECGIVALGAAAIGAGAAMYALRGTTASRRQIWTAGAVGAVIFAAQMFNVQVLPFSSAHLVGGVLAAWLLGPPLGVLAMSAILLIEALVLGDGGLMALGPNIINMAIIPAAAVALVRRYAPAAVSPTRSGLLLAATSFGAVMLAATLILGEVAIGRAGTQLQGFGAFASQLLLAHVAVGLLEAGITVAVVAAVGGLSGQPALVRRWSFARVGALTALAFALAVLSSPALGLASDKPDGYQAAVASASPNTTLANLDSANGLCGVNLRVQQFQLGVVNFFHGSEALVGALATLAAGIVVGGIGWGVGGGRTKYGVRSTEY